MRNKLPFLFLILIVPILLVAFLYSCGENHYKLPVYYENGLEFEDSEPGKPHTLPYFEFKKQDGGVFNSDSIKGKIVIGDFIFTRCEGICPQMTGQLKRVQDAFINQPDVIIISHTVDPEYDTTQVLNDYAKQYGALNGKWYFLTGTKEKLYEHARKGYVLPVQDGDGGPEDFVHSEKVVLIDKKGRIRGYYDGTDPLKVDTLILETRVLLTEKE